MSDQDNPVTESFFTGKRSANRQGSGDQVCQSVRRTFRNPMSSAVECRVSSAYICEVVVCKEPEATNALSTFLSGCRTAGLVGQRWLAVVGS